MRERGLSAVCVAVFLLALLNAAETYENTNQMIQPNETFIGEPVNEEQVYFGSDGYLDRILSEEDKEALRKVSSYQEEDVYTFLQGPRSWGEGIPWSGEWCAFNIEGNPFGGFGCGLCCLANIYNTLSPYEVSPLDTYEYARTVTDYTPTGEMGAIDWEYMKKTLECCGFACELYRKPGSYEEFREQMEQAESAIVLISSYNDDKYWQDTPGHYVNIWLYEEGDETVFLAEPGDPENNRSRISLRYVYDALKTASRYHYLMVEDYFEEQNQWKADGIEENWNRPANQAG